MRRLIRFPGFVGGLIIACAPVAAPPSPSKPSCSSERVHGDPQRQVAGGCATDADCKAGRNGRCGPRSYEAPTEDICYYDACNVDADCATGAACACGNGSATGPHTCVPAACRTDTDCGDG